MILAWAPYHFHSKPPRMILNIRFSVSYSCNISVADNCASAFGRFQRCYDKQYSSTTIASAERAFCSNFHRLLSYQFYCPQCDVTPNMDVPNAAFASSSPSYPKFIIQKEGTLRRKLLSNEKSLPSHLSSSNSDENASQFDPMSCQLSFCFNFDPLPLLEQIYASVDLREAGLVTPAKSQRLPTPSFDNETKSVTYSDVTCGGSWAFVANALLENAILFDRGSYPPSSPWAEATNATLNLSEQWLLVNELTNESAQMNCIVGDVVTALLYIYTNIQNHFPEGCEVNMGAGPPTERACVAQSPTVELAANFPNDWSTVTALANLNTPLLSHLPTADYLIPFRAQPQIYGDLYGENSTLANSPIVALFYDMTDGAKFDPDTVHRIRSYLSRGIAVAGRMYVPQLTCAGLLTINDCDNTSLSSLKQYDGTSVLSFQCPNFMQNHYITFIGYGKKNKQDVWVVKNSWGNKWGSNGSFYVRFGYNDFCIEQYAFAIIPKKYNIYLDNYSKIIGLNHNLRGKTSLDADQGQPTQNNYELPVQIFTPLLILSLIVIGIVTMGLISHNIIKCIKETKIIKTKPTGVEEKRNID